MQCDWKYVGPSKMEGFRYYECSRAPCKMYSHSPYESDNISNDLDSPCQGRPRLYEWGGWVEFLLESWFFVSKSRWLWVKRRMGFKPHCPCPQNEAALNHLGQRTLTAINHLGHQTLTALATSYYAASGLAIH